MIGLKDFLAQLVMELQRADIPYMICGSLSSGVHGESRSTNDVDIIVAPTEEQLNQLVKAFDPHYYISEDAAIEAFRNRTMFNVIDAQSGLKADIILQKMQPYHQEEFRRRRPESFMGIEVIVSSPEDTILSKLVWAKAGDSERQLRDALGVAAVQGDALDKAYMRKWAKELKVEEILEKVLSEAKKLGA